jgi:hypothetical protein
MPSADDSSFGIDQRDRRFLFTRAYRGHCEIQGGCRLTVEIAAAN